MSATEDWFTEEVARCARAAHAVLMQSGGLDELWLYFRRGSLVFAADKPDGYELGCAERCPRHLEVGQLIAWTHKRARRLGCLPEEPPATT